MIKVVAHEDCPTDRIFIQGAPARLSNFKLHDGVTKDDGSIEFRITADVEYDPIYQCVIRLDGDD